VGLAERVRSLVAPAPQFTQEHLRGARPLRNPHVSQSALEGGGILLTAPLVLQGKGVMGWIANRMRLPDTKSFELEPIGAFVWELCDGRHTFDAIARKLRDRYRMNRLEAEAALTAFLQMLGQRRLISLNLGKRK